MAKVSKNKVTLFVIIACLAVFGGVKYLQSRSITPVSAVNKLPERAKGTLGANIKIIEFIDFQCPSCATGSKVLHEYLEKNPGKIYVELRYFPLQMHKHGFASARWAECAGRQGKFWPFLDPLLEKQSSWSALIDPLPAFTAIAKEAQVDMDKLNACLTDKSVDETINADLDEGKMRQVASTPSYFINHELVVGTKSLRSKLDNLLGIKKEAAAP